MGGPSSAPGTGAARAARRPELPLVVHLARQAGDVDAALDVAHGEPGPPGKVERGRGTARREVASRELVERLIALARRPRGDALVEQRIGELFSTARAADHDAIQLGLHEQSA